jgi:hypothetical protein
VFLLATIGWALVGCGSYEAVSPSGPMYLHRSFPKPELIEVSTKLIDDSGDGVLETGESGRLRVTLQNTSKITARGLRVVLTPSDPRAIQCDGESTVGDLSAGEERSIEIPLMGINIGPGFVATVSVGVVEKSGTGPGDVLVSVARPIIDVVDVDVNIPSGRDARSEAVAVVIGISRYQDKDVPRVEFARHDAEIVREYFIRVLGLRPDRIITLFDENASLSAFKRVFEQQLGLRVRRGVTDVFVYYSGHGAPDVENRSAYFVPWDCEPEYARSTGYSVKEMYTQLQSLKAKSVTVLTDACFSGLSERGALLKGTSPIVVVQENPIGDIANGLAFASAAANQVSGWYQEKKHSLFTYFLLRAMRGDADLDRNGEITFQELESYVGSQVSELSRSMNGREQTPVMTGPGGERVFVRY